MHMRRVSTSEGGYLRVQDDPDSFVDVRRLVQEHCAEPVCMAHDRDASTVLDAPDEAVAPPRDHQIDVLVEFEERGDFGSCLDGLDVGARYAGFRERGLYSLREQLCCLI